MAIERDNKLLDGAGLEQYTELLKGKFDEVAGDITEITNIVNGITNTTIPGLEEDISDAQGDINDIITGLTTIIEEVWGDAAGTEPSRIDDLESAVDGITSIIGDVTTPLDETFKVIQTAATLNAPAGEYISGITQDIQGVVGITTLALPTVADASDTTPGVVQMATGATTSTVYSKEQVDEAARLLTQDILSSVNEDFKQKQVAYNSGVTTNLTFIDYIYQDEQGVITTTMATVTIADATDSAAGLVTMAGGATTSVVYDVDQVDSLIEGINNNIDGITTTISGIQDDITGLTGTYKQLQSAATLSVSAGEYIVGVDQTEQGVVSISTATFPVASTIPGMVTVVGVTTATTHPISEVYNRDKIDELLADIESGGSATYKTRQNAVELTITSGNYISYLYQNENGVITATTSTLPTASTTSQGLVTLASGATTSTVYDKDQIDDLISGITTNVGDLDDRLDDLEGSVQGTGAKRLQAAVSSPAAGSTPAIEFIDTISQNANGDISVTKQAVRTAAANVSGIVSLATGASTSVVYTADQVDDAINAAIGSFITAQVVAADQQGYPDVQTPEENVVYLVPNGTSSEPNYYIEYMWIDGNPTGSWEVVGNTELAIETLSNNEVISIFNGVFNS